MLGSCIRGGRADDVDAGTGSSCGAPGLPDAGGWGSKDAAAKADADIEGRNFGVEGALLVSLMAAPRWLARLPAEGRAEGSVLLAPAASADAVATFKAPRSAFLSAAESRPSKGCCTLEVGDSALGDTAAEREGVGGTGVAEIVVDTRSCLLFEEWCGGDAKRK